MPLDAQIDDLYQLPLSEFTTARNALAKTAGADAARVKALEKPVAAAWAVNQVYWRNRKLYDAVIKMAARRQKAHAQSLGGKKSDVALAEAEHAAAVREAADAAEKHLRQGGDAASDATMTAVRETLSALPSSDPPGRLTKPLGQAVGFGALGDLLRGAPIHAAKPADVVSFKKPARAETETPKRDRAAEREAERAEAAAKAARKELDAKIRTADAALAKARQALADLEQERRDLNARLNAVTDEIEQARTGVHQREAERHALDRERLSLG